VIVAVAWLGAVFAKVVLGVIAVTSSAPAYSRSLYIAMDAINITYPMLAVLTAITGVLLSLGTKWGLLQHYWVVTKIVLTVAVIVTAIAIGGRLGREAVAAASGQDTGGVTIVDIVTEPAGLLLALSAAHLAMLVIATVLSVYKPWGKTWFSRRKAGGARIDYTMGYTIETGADRARSAGARE
jgi:hypothetical protein